MAGGSRDGLTAPSGPTHPHRQLGYMPALDGLRAVAVGSVFLYHLNVRQLVGGYLGVDVFFVLSGFLITALLLAELDRWGSVDLVAFWVRRARRLLPAVFVVMAAVVAYANFLAQPAQRAQLRGDGLATLLYYSNWRFIYAGESYFAQYGDPSPLRHTWSLAIEEQWYLVLPLVLSALAALGLLSRRALAVAFGVGAVASAGWAAHLYDPDVDPSRVYYGTDTRLQGLLTGACLAAILGHRVWSGHIQARETRSTFLQVGSRALPLNAAMGLQALGVACAGAIAGAMLLLPESSRWLYQGGFLAVAVATSVVIWVTCHDGPLAHVLSARPLRWLGRISYGVYLWHWPVIVILSSERTGLDGLSLGLLRALVTVAISMASYRFIEVPVRRGQRRTISPRRLVRAPVVAVVPTFLVLALVAATPPDPQAGKTVDGLSVSQHTAPAGDGRVLLVGDSTAFTLGLPWSPELTPGVTVTSSTRLGCGFARGGRAIGAKRYPAEEKCGLWPTDWAKAVEDSKPELVLLMAGAWEVVDHVVDGIVLSVGTDAYGSYLKKELDAASEVLRASGARLGLVMAPCFQEPDGGMYGPDLERQRNDPKRVSWLNAQYEKYASAHPGAVEVIHLEGLLCGQDGGALPMVGNLPAASIRNDGVHYTEQGAALVWRWMAPQLASLSGSGAQRTAYFVGDSVPYGLRDVTRGSHGEFELKGATLLGCGLVTTPRVIGGRVEGMPARCPEWSAAWPKDAASAEYTVGVLWPGTGELFDHRVGGKTLTFASPAFRDYLKAQYGRAIDALAAGDHPVAVVTMPCHGIAEGDGREAPIINDSERVSWINDVVSEVAREHGAAVVDLNARLCRDGYTNTSGSVTLRTDGLHFTPEGARIVLDWLLPELSRLTGISTR